MLFGCNNQCNILLIKQRCKVVKALVVRTLRPRPHVFKAPDGLTLKAAWLGFGIKTCRSHTAACALVLEPGRGRPEPAPPLTETGSRPAPDKLGSQECCIHFDRHLLRKKKEALGLDISSR